MQRSQRAWKDRSDQSASDTGAFHLNKADLKVKAAVVKLQDPLQGQLPLMPLLNPVQVLLSQDIQYRHCGIYQIQSTL